MKDNNVFYNLGFSAVELIIVLGIFTLVLSLAIPSFGNWHASVLANDAYYEIVDALRLVKSRSQSGYNNSAHGVYLTINSEVNDKYTIYQGNSFLDRDVQYDQAYILNNNINIVSNISGNDINFSQGLGLSSATGTIEINQASVLDSREIAINIIGLVE